MAYVYRGRVRLMKSLFSQAKQDFSSAIKIDPKDPNSFLYRAMAWRGMGMMAEAAEDYRVCLRLVPQHADRAQLERFIRKYGK